MQRRAWILWGWERGVSQRSNICYRFQRMRSTWPSRGRGWRAFWAKGTAPAEICVSEKGAPLWGALWQGRGPVCPQPEVRPGSDPCGAWGGTEQVRFVFCLFSDPSGRRWLLRSVVPLVTETEAKGVCGVWSDAAQTRPPSALRSSSVGSLSVVGSGSEATHGAPGFLSPPSQQPPWLPQTLV